MTKKRRKRHTRTPLQRRARKGFRGYPVATVAYYGPDDQFASKVAVGIMLQEDGEVAFLERWFAQDQDVRLDPRINQEIVAFTRQHQVKSVVMADRIIGCPHEEGIDYPEGESCPQCPFWAGRDRWTGELVGREVRSEPEVEMVMGCAWYRADQWDRLCEISVDGEKLEETHAEWMASAEESLREMRNMGMRVDKVEVDVEELLAWCKARQLDVDGGARAKYAAEMLRQRGAGHGRGSNGV
jgi:hypothetical protein